MRRELAHERARRVEPAGASRDDLLDRLESGRRRSPARPAARGATSAEARRTRDSATYGGFETTSRRRPRRAPGSASNHEPRARRTRVAGRPGAGQVGARDGEGVVARRRCAHTSASGSSLASASANAPEPVPRSAIEYVVCRPRPRVGAPRRAPSRTASSIATCAVTSVSGRGISTRRSTSRSSPRNGQTPSTYWSGSPAMRRADQLGQVARRTGSAPARPRRRRARRRRTRTPARRSSALRSRAASTPAAASDRSASTRRSRQLGTVRRRPTRAARRARPRSARRRSGRAGPRAPGRASAA